MSVRYCSGVVKWGQVVRNPKCHTLRGVKVSSPAPLQVTGTRNDCELLWATNHFFMLLVFFAQEGVVCNCFKCLQGGVQEKALCCWVDLIFLQSQSKIQACHPVDLRGIFYVNPSSSATFSSAFFLSFTCFPNIYEHKTPFTYVCAMKISHVYMLFLATRSACA